MAKTPSASKDDDEPHNGKSLEERIRAAYALVVDGSDGWVNLMVIRSHFPDVSKADLDKTLEHMLDMPDVWLEPEANRHRLGKAEKEASVRIGGEDRHKLAIGRG